MGRSGRRKQQQQQQQQQVQPRRASVRSRCVSATPDVCLVCLDDEGWCFLCGEVRYLPLVKNPPWQGEEEYCPGQEPEDEEAEQPQPKAPLAGEYLLVSPPPPPSEGKEQELPLHPPRRTGPLSSEGIWDWLAEPERNVVEALPAVINLLWARDGERWEAWEKQHHPSSLPDIAAMVLNYLAVDMGGAPLPYLALEGEEPLLPSAVPEGEEPSLSSPTPEGEEPSLPSPAPEGEEPSL
ncbi:UNVERIFIED_CONTAM: hypothetical protein FKN15_013782 [Acipenser sinensis]